MAYNSTQRIRQKLVFFWFFCFFFFVFLSLLGAHGLCHNWEERMRQLGECVPPAIRRLFEAENQIIEIDEDEVCK